MIRFGVFLALLIAVAAAMASGREIHCAVYSEAPWHFEGIADQQGVADYYAEKFSNVSGYAIALHHMPYKRSIRSVFSDSIDFVVALSNPELEEHALPYVRIGRVALMLYSYRPIRDLYETPVRDVELVVMSGFEGNGDIDLPAWRYEIANSEALAVRAVARKRYDATVVTRNTYEYLIEKEPALANAYVKDIGFANVYAWMSKDKAGAEPFKDAKKIIETHSFGGKLVLDWYTVSLPIVAD